MHSIHLVCILQHLPNATSICSLISILVTHASKVDEILHVGQVRHVLKLVDASIEIIVALVDLHVVEGKALRHLVLIELGELLLIWHEILARVL